MFLCDGREGFSSISLVPAFQSLAKAPVWDNASLPKLFSKCPKSLKNKNKKPSSPGNCPPFLTFQCWTIFHRFLGGRGGGGVLANFLNEFLCVQGHRKSFWAHYELTALDNYTARFMDPKQGKLFPLQSLLIQHIYGTVLSYWYHQWNGTYEMQGQGRYREGNPSLHSTFHFPNTKCLALLYLWNIYIVSPQLLKWVLTKPSTGLKASDGRKQGDSISTMGNVIPIGPTLQRKVSSLGTEIQCSWNVGSERDWE